MLLVKRASGPETARAGETIVFRATEFNQTSPNEAELAAIRWLIESDDGTELVREQAGASIAFDVPASLVGRALIAMPFRNSPARHVSATTLIQASAEAAMSAGMTAIRKEFGTLLSGDLSQHSPDELLDRTIGLRGALDDLIDSVQPLLADESDDPADSQPELADDARRLAIVVGHTQSRAGATAVAPISAQEYEFNCDIAERIEAAARPAGVAVRVFKRDRVGIAGAYAAAAAFQPAGIIELHFNAFSQASAHGTSTLCSQDHPRSKTLAEHVQAAMVAVFERSGRGDRGIQMRARGDRGHGNVSAQPGIPTVLVEPYFGSNADDCRMADERRQQYAAALIDAFRSFVAAT